MERAMTLSRIALIGFGEVGQILGKDLAANGVEDISAWDLKFDDADSGPSRALTGNYVTAGADVRDAVRGAGLVISAVTAAQTVAAAQSVAGAIGPGAFFADMNSASPSVKTKAAAIINDAGGRYVDVAVMAPIAPKRLATPMLMGGPHARALIDAAHGLGFDGAVFFDDAYGKAAAAKMCRSIVVKGMETLLTEALLTARHYGVDASVIASLDDLFPGQDWNRLAHYMIARSLEHGARRAEEMREAARTVSEANVAPLMSAACAERQDWAAAHKAAINQAALIPMLDAILKTIQADKDAGAC
jgi:3-hydroxyisobutyrate dehydrogenase-like beta-hydroxyacid dehydrogenase